LARLLLLLLVLLELVLLVLVLVLLKSLPATLVYLMAAACGIPAAPAPLQSLRRQPAAR
jgi:hypothetical protein